MRRSEKEGFPPQRLERLRYGEAQPEKGGKNAGRRGRYPEAPEGVGGDYISHKSTGQGEGRASGTIPDGPCPAMSR